MRHRILLGSILLVAGVAAPAVAFSVYGPPWGFRDAAAVLLEATGDVQITGGDARGSAARSAIQTTGGQRLYPGDVVRVGRFSEARLRFPSSDVALRDGARAVVVDDRLMLGRGVAEVVVQQGARGAPIDVEGADPERADAQITVQPGRTVVSADGRGTSVVVVKEGSAQALSVLGGESAEPAHALTIVRGKPPTVAPVSKAMELTAACDASGRRVVGKAPAAAQLYLNGKLEYPDVDGSFSFEWPAGATEAILFARDPAGLVERRLLSCKAG